jgi:iron complex outermembrane receptor protein
MTIALATRRMRTIVLCCLAGLCTANLAFAQIANDRVHVDIPAQSLSSALTQFGRDTGTEIVFTPEAVSQKMSTAIKGDFAREKAISLLLDGTGLTYRVTTQGAIIINAAPASKSSSAGSVRSDQAARLAQSNAAGSQSQSNIDGPQDTNASSSQSESEKDRLSEIVVTGTHIHGGKNATSPLTSLTREDIERTGVSSTEELIRTLPQNFAGGATDLTNSQFFAGEGSDTNFSQGAGVNLRGLGNDATLLLLNGRRLAAADLGSFVDVSLIPLSAIDRVEVMTDGASAIYGSDAVGGVINIITRKNYEGAATRVRYGSVTSGDRQEIQVGQVVGHEWNSGSALISYDYLHDSAMNAGDRSFASGITQPPAGSGAPAAYVDLLPRESRQNVLTSVSQALTSNVDTFADGYYAKREVRGIQALFSRTITEEIDAQSSNEQYGGTLGLTAHLAADWHGESAATYSRNNSSQHNSFAGVPLRANFGGHASAFAIDASADGKLLSVSGGPLKAAFGGQYRRETYDSQGTRDPIFSGQARTVAAAFGELLVPLVGDGNAVAGMRSLDLSIAGRYEHYSDFGSTTNPKYGLSWSPVAALHVRGTWGTSYRAPLLSELDNSQPVIFAFPYPSVSGSTPAIYLFGGNPQLKPEKATTWTAGADFVPVSIPNMKVALTYFSIAFKDRIGSPIPSSATCCVLINAGPYAPFLTLNPSSAVIAQYFNSRTFRNPYGLTPGSIGAIIDNNLTNVSVRDEEGADLTLQDRVETAIGRFDGTVSATYLTRLQDTILPGTAPVNLAGTVFYPVKFKMRDSIGWTRSGLSATAFLNYSGGYRNNIVTPSQGIASWTTVDFTVRYDSGTNTSLAAARNIIISFSLLNAFDRNPPYVTATAASGVNFDAANASPLGRFASLEVSKAW